MPASDWEAFPFPELTDEQLTRIIARHRLGVSLAGVQPLPRVGIINTALALGDRCVLRVPKNMDEGIRDTYTESVAAPAARAAGLKTPELLVFDDSHTILDVPFTVYERVHGQNFHLTDHDVPGAAEVYRELGRQLALLHERVAACPDPNGYLDGSMDHPLRVEAPRQIADRLATAGKLSARNMRWLDRVLARVEPAVSAAAELRRFLHNDAHPGNILVRDGAYAALIDWNDAGWGDPALEFAQVPAPAVPYALAGYRELHPLDQDDTAEARILSYQLSGALHGLEKDARPDIPSWWPPASELIDIIPAAASFSTWSAMLS